MAKELGSETSILGTTPSAPTSEDASRADDAAPITTSTVAKSSSTLSAVRRNARIRIVPSTFAMTEKQQQFQTQHIFRVLLGWNREREECQKLFESEWANLPIMMPHQWSTDPLNCQVQKHESVAKRPRTEGPVTRSMTDRAHVAASN